MRGDSQRMRRCGVCASVIADVISRASRTAFKISRLFSAQSYSLLSRRSVRRCPVPDRGQLASGTRGITALHAELAPFCVAIDQPHSFPDMFHGVVRPPRARKRRSEDRDKCGPAAFLTPGDRTDEFDDMQS